MSKKKSSRNNRRDNKGVCPYCNGEEVVARECVHCWGVGCFECDGQGYEAFECWHCRDRRADSSIISK